MNGTFTALTLFLGMAGWGLCLWAAIGILALLVYCPRLRKIDGCWTHSVVRQKDRVADLLGYYIEMQEYVRLVFAAPILVPIGLITLRRNGLYGEHRPAYWTP